MQTSHQSRLPVLFFIVSLFALSACNSQPDPSSSASAECPGSSITDNQRHLKAKVSVPLGNGSVGYLDIYVQRLEKTDAYSWSATPVTTFDTGLTPCETMQAVETMWQTYYADMVTAGIHPDVIAHYISSISAYGSDSNRALAGVYAETHLGACGYAGSPGTIYCGLGTDEGFKQYYLAHENTHGFQWDWSSGSDEGILLYRIFASYANSIYHQSVSDASYFEDTGGVWNISTQDYALQNEAEWLAEVFRDYLYPGTGHWAYIQSNHSELTNFLNCVWKQGKTFTQCHSETSVPTVAFANKLPVVDLPAVGGYNATEQEAIWNICFNSQAMSNHIAAFDALIDWFTPGLYSNSANLYELGYGDCDHNGVIDWICSYKGPAPDGGAYLWNSNNQTGAPTFIASGDSSINYADYRQDPYLELPTINGSLAQPMYREWQGTYGSCNGSRYFNQVPDRFPSFASQVVGLPAEYEGKVSW